MSEHASPTAAARGSATLETGLEALESSSEFHGPVEALDGHHCNDHFAQIYERGDERFTAAVPFVRHGLEQDERVMYVIDESSEAEVHAALHDGGIDVDAALDTGQFSLHTVQDTYLRNGSFEPDEMINFYADTVAAATEEYEALRIVAETTWLQDEATTVEQFMEYESKINDLFADENCLALCQYDRNGFSPDVVRNIVQTHPHLIYDGAVCHNFYYTPPAEFFGPDEPTRENDRMLQTLRERTLAKTELQQRERFLQEFSEVTADSTRSFNAKIRRLLELGIKRFDLEIGYFARTHDDDMFKIVDAVGPNEQIAPGVTDSLCDTYCEKLLASPGLISVTDAADAGWTDDPAYERFGLDAYFATTVHVGGEEYGTLCFASETPREESYTDAERAFLDLMGRWMGDELERRRRERYLRESYEITSDPTLSFEEKLQALFDLGCEQFGLDLGAMAKVDPDEDRFEVEYVSDDHDHFEPELELPLSETYCTAATKTGGVESVDDPVEAGYDDMYVHREFGLKTYLGTYIEVEGDLNRTFFFVSEEPQNSAFSDDERTFQRLLGQWVKYELERQQRERFLRESLQITSAPTLDFERKLERLLDLGRDWMNLDAAGLTHLPSWDDKFLTEYAIGYGDGEDEVVDASDGLWTNPDEGHYCRQAIESDEPVGKADVRGTDWENDPIHQEHGLTCYLGTKVMNGSTPYGTLWVGGTEPRGREFSKNERTFLELMGRWVSYELERNHREAQLQQKNDRLESFASMLAHELRNPTMIGQIYSQQLPDDTDLEAVEYVTEAFDRIENMVDVMLMLTRGSEAVDGCTSVELADVAEQVWTDVDTPNAALDVEIDGTIQADETYIHHLFRNLLENAVQHGGTDVTVTVGELPSGFYVADDGPGIPAEDRDAVFDQGYTTAADSGGTGLGLAFVQKLAEVYKWDCTVTESDAGGARFEFRNVTQHECN